MGTAGPQLCTVSFHPEIQAEGTTPAWGVLSLRQREKSWQKLKMLLRVFALKLHNVTSPHFPLTQESLWPTRQWGKAVYPLPHKKAYKFTCKFSRERSELLRAVMQPTLVYSGQNACAKGTAFSFASVFFCIFFSYLNELLSFLNFYSPIRKAREMQWILKEVRVFPYVWFILDSVQFWLHSWISSYGRVIDAWYTPYAQFIYLILA